MSGAGAGSLVTKYFLDFGIKLLQPNDFKATCVPVWLLDNISREAHIVVVETTVGVLTEINADANENVIAVQKTSPHLITRIN